MAYTTTEEFDKAHQDVKAAFASGITKDKAWRRQQLKRAWVMVDENRERLLDALKKDLNKPRLEALIVDINGVLSDITQNLDNLDEWTADVRPSRKEVINFAGKVTLRREPLGVTFIIGAWNFPVQLLLQPMVAAIASGCAMILKPSDVAVHCEQLLMELIPKYMDQRAIRCITAGPREMEHILQRRFNHIFYTGSSHVGKIIYAAAAKHLTPVTLELGGQGPAIVCKSADIDVAARRIAAGKFANAGQICINVNHILVDPSVREALVTRLIHYFNVYRGGDSDELRPDYYTHIVNDRNFSRLSNLLDNTKGKLVYGGVRDVETRFFYPAIVVNVQPDDSLMSEEIFGPILPIIDADLDTAIDFTAAGEHPLALYAFTQSSEEKKRILDSTNSGGVTFNDCMLHAAAYDAPFGGVGTSGFGSYHGRYGIYAFTHLRTCLEGFPSWMDKALDFRFPPYTEDKVKKLDRRAAGFDMDGNDKRGASEWIKWVVGLAFAGTAWILRR